MPGEYYHPLLVFGFWLEDEGNEVDWDRIYESIEMLNSCVRTPEPCKVGAEESSMTHLEYDEPAGKMQPGTWMTATRDGKPIVRIACPNCGRAGALEPDDHTVHRAGGVSPSVVCDCGFHDRVHLDGWVG